MKRNGIVSLIVLVLALPAWAEGKPDAPPKEPKSAKARKPTGPSAGPLHERMLERAFGALDANGDGSIDADEFRGQFPRLVERVRGEMHRRMERLPSREEIQRWIDERVGQALDRARDRFAHRPPPPPFPPEDAPPGGHAFGAEPPLAGPIFRDDDPDRPGPPRRGPQGPDHHRREAGRHGRGGPPMLLMRLFDANKDGRIDEAEIDQAGQRLRKLDVNSDGEITPADIEKLMSRHKRKGGRPPKHGNPNRPERRSRP